MAVEEGVRAVLLEVIEVYPLLQVGSGRDQLAQDEQGPSEDAVGFQEERGVLLVLGKAEKPLPQLVGSLVLCPHEMKLC